ncbi:MAG: hypothetical protein EOP06_00030 [Proteobacteria bacterium]|nr:MAG: hypothetical protein EOP06_00030 [Pseudomonadota bacterium]
MNVLKGLLAISLLGLATGCTTAEKSFRNDEVLDKVAYKFNCPKDQIKIDVLKRNEGLGCAGSEVGVSGCGQRALYVCNGDQKWVIDEAAPN